MTWPKDFWHPSNYASIKSVKFMKRVGAAAANMYPRSPLSAALFIYFKIFVYFFFLSEGWFSIYTWAGLGSGPQWALDIYFPFRTIWYFENLKFFHLHSGRAQSGLSQKYAFIKKSTIFTQSLRNFVKIRYTWGPYFDKVSQWLGKNCGFFNKSIFLAKSGLGSPGV